MSAATQAPALRSAAIRSVLGLSPGYAEERAYTGVSSDTRTLRPGDLFVALQGERHDAADFLSQAAARGAPGAIVPAGREDPALPLEYFGVPDPLRALGDLAARARRASTAAVIAITGSSGKTTVKEMLACALAESRRVYRTEGNLNSQVGLPLTILRAPAEADAWVLEVGASEPGEIGRLAEIARPDHVVITTVGAAHLEFFGDVTGVLREKMRLAHGASGRGALVVGEEPDILPAAARAHRSDAIVAGIGAGADFRPDERAVGSGPGRVPPPERAVLTRRGRRAPPPRRPHRRGRGRGDGRTSGRRRPWAGALRAARHARRHPAHRRAHRARRLLQRQPRLVSGGDRTGPAPAPRPPRGRVRGLDA